MKLFNQYTKYLLSGSIIAATLLSSTNVSLASGTNTEDNKKPSNDDAIAFGNTKNPKNVIFFSWRWNGSFFQYCLSLLSK